MDEGIIAPPSFESITNCYSVSLDNAGDLIVWRSQGRQPMSENCSCKFQFLRLSTTVA